MAPAPLWPAAADEWLKSLPIGLDLARVHCCYTEEAQRRGWPMRTQKAVELRRRHLASDPDYSRLPRSVRCELSGEVWPSIRAAANAVGTPDSNLVNAFQRNGRWRSLVPCDSMEAP